MSEQSCAPPLPPLIGTERQLEMGDKPSATSYSCLPSTPSSRRSLPETPEVTVRDALGWLSSITDAGSWLDHSDLSKIDVVRVALGGVAARWHPTNVDSPSAWEDRGT
jgi:hypothetical protein